MGVCQEKQEHPAEPVQERSHIAAGSSAAGQGHPSSWDLDATTSKPRWQAWSCGVFAWFCLVGYPPFPPPFFKNRNTSLHCILEMYNLLSVLTGHTSKSFPCLNARRGFGLKYKKKTSTYFNFI